MGLANGIHHLALSTNDMRKQIDFYTQVCGLELTGLFTMHGTQGAYHCFLKLNDSCYLSFVQTNDGADKRPVEGTSHAEHVIAGVAPGAMQHVALTVPTQAALIAMRNRIRAAGYQVIGPIGHGICDSIYLFAPEDTILEFVSAEKRAALDPELWIEPEIQHALGIGDDDLVRYTHPVPPAVGGPPVPQPPFDPAKQRRPLPVPPQMLERVASMTDEQVREMLTWEEPPNRTTERRVLA
jgi:catechol 2,3-dioxygenase-like lactoylglutathione lyase family enzyme